MKKYFGGIINFEETPLFSCVLTIIAATLIWSSIARAEDVKPPDLNGVWANALLTPEDERWRLVDIACARTGCSLTGFSYLQALLEDKKNNHRSMKELFFDMREYEKKQNEIYEEHSNQIQT